MANTNALNLETLPRLHSDKLQLVFNYLKFKKWDAGDENGVTVLRSMIKKCRTDADYLCKFKHYIESGSTLELRELVEPFGNYWDSAALTFHNAVDAIDAAFSKSGNEQSFPTIYPNLTYALANALFINIDGITYHIEAWVPHEGKLYFSNPATGDEYVNSYEELESDKDEFELIGLTPILFER